MPFVRKMCKMIIVTNLKWPFKIIHVIRVANRLRSGQANVRIFTEQKSNVKNDPHFRFFAFDLCL